MLSILVLAVTCAVETHSLQNTLVTRIYNSSPNCTYNCIVGNTWEPHPCGFLKLRMSTGEIQLNSLLMPKRNSEMNV